MQAVSTFGRSVREQLSTGAGELRVTGPEFEQLLVTFLGWVPSPIRNVDAPIPPPVGQPTMSPCLTAGARRGVAL